MDKINILPLILTSAFVSSGSFAAGPVEIRQETPQAPLDYGLTDEFTTDPKHEEYDFEIRTSGAHYFKRAITSTKPRITSSENFIPLLGAETTIVIPPGKSAMVNVAFTAESSCTEINSSAGNWCEVRIIVDGIEAAPAASTFPPDTYAFDSTDSGDENLSSWESHAMDRHKCIDNSRGHVAKTVPINVDWKVTNFDGGNAPYFWLDDWSLTVELANTCRFEKGSFH
jgi:hypothetical protein